VEQALSQLHAPTTEDAFELGDHGSPGLRRFNQLDEFGEDDVPQLLRQTTDSPFNSPFQLPNSRQRLA